MMELKMPAITASMVAELRAKTDAPMMMCKKALTEADGDLAKAEELLRVKLGTKAPAAATRLTAEGVVAAYVAGNVGAMVEVNCETDFVTKNDDFIAFANKLAKLVVEKNPADVAALSALELEGSTVDAVRLALVGKIGEKHVDPPLQALRELQAGVVPARHAHRRGRQFEGDDTAAKDVAMHVAAMKPVALSQADVAPELVEKERSIASQKAAESGKPAEIVAKMVEGSVQKFLKEVSLLNQPFVKNDKQSVEQMLKAANTTVKGFTLFVVGEGIEKKSDNFADEVAAQVACRARPVSRSRGREPEARGPRLTLRGFEPKQVAPGRVHPCRRTSASF
jgi:elongation factor Ts